MDNSGEVSSDGGFSESDYATTDDYEETTYDYELAEELEDVTEEELLEDLDNIAVDDTVTLELGEDMVGNLRQL